MSKACAICDTKNTPQWRGVFCNACGIREATRNKRLGTKKNAVVVEANVPQHILLPRSILHTLLPRDVNAAYAYLEAHCK